MKHALCNRLLWTVAIMLGQPLVAAAADEGAGTTPGKNDAASVIIIILFAAFAIDWIVSAALSLLSSARLLPPTPPRGTEDRRHKMAYLVLSAILGVLLGIKGKVWVLASLGFSQDKALNVIATTFILMAGSDRIGMLLGELRDKGPEPTNAEPIEIKGEVSLVERTDSKPAPPPT